MFLSDCGHTHALQDRRGASFIVLLTFDQTHAREICVRKSVDKGKVERERGGEGGRIRYYGLSNI